MEVEENSGDSKTIRVLFNEQKRAVVEWCRSQKRSPKEIAADLRSCADCLVDRFDVFRDKYGKNFNNLRGLAALAASIAVLTASYDNASPMLTGALVNLNMLGGAALFIGEGTDFVRGDEGDGFKKSFALASIGQGAVFVANIGISNGLSIAADLLLVPYYMLGLGEERLIDKFGEDKSVVRRRVLGDPRVTAAAFSLAACTIFLAQTWGDGNSALRIASALWVIEDMLHGASSSEGRKYEKPDATKWPLRRLMQSLIRSPDGLK